MATIPVAPMGLRPMPDPTEGFKTAAQLNSLNQTRQLQQQQMQENQLTIQQKQKAIQDHQLAAKAIQDAGGDMDKALKSIQGKVDPSFQAQLEQEHATQLDNAMKRQVMQGAIEDKNNETLYNIVDQVKQMSPEQFEQNKPLIAQKISQINPQIQMPPDAKQSDMDGLLFGLRVKKFYDAAAKAQIDNQKNQAATAKDAAEAQLKQQEADQMKQFGGMTQGAADSKYRYLQQQKALGTALAPADQAFLTAYEKQKTLVPQFKIDNRVPGNNPALDRSYNYNQSRITAERKPAADRIERIARLEASLDQNSPQADALVAPELLTAMAGGQGSGLRMNEAEISRIVGGRNAWEGLKSNLLKLQTDPNKPFLIPDNQRAQIRSLINAVKDRATKVSNIYDDTEQKLVDAKSVTEHRQILANMHKQLTAMDSGASSGVSVSVGGKTYSFPNQAAADAFKKEAGIQ